MKRISVLLMALVLVMAMGMDVQAAKKVPVNTENTEISKSGESVMPAQVPILRKGYVLLEVVLDYTLMPPDKLVSGDGAVVKIEEVDSAGTFIKTAYPWQWWSRYGSVTAQPITEESATAESTTGQSTTVQRNKEMRPVSIALTTKQNIPLPEGKNYKVITMYLESAPTLASVSMDLIYARGGSTGGDGTINNISGTPSITIQIKEPD